MMKLSICNELFKDWPFEKTLDFAARTGYNGIEIAPFTLAESVNDISSTQRQELKGQISKSGLECVGLHWLLASPKGFHLNHPDKDLRDKTKQYLIDLIKFCSDLEGQVMVIGSPKQRDVVRELDYQEAWDLAKEVFQDCVKVAEQEGVTLCIEPLARKETNFITTHKESIRMIQEINHPNFKLNLDVKAMSDEGTPIPEIIKSSREHLAHFHANDTNRREPGSGSVDFAPIMKVLQEINYAGYVSVEVFDFTEGPEKIATRGLETLKKYC